MQCIIHGCDAPSIVAQAKSIVAQYLVDGCATKYSVYCCTMLSPLLNNSIHCCAMLSWWLTMLGPLLCNVRWILAEYSVHCCTLLSGSLCNTWLIVVQYSVDCCATLELSLQKNQSIVVQYLVNCCKVLGQSLINIHCCVIISCNTQLIFCNMQSIVAQCLVNGCAFFSHFLHNSGLIAAKYSVNHCAILSLLLRNSLLAILSQLLCNTWSNCCHSCGSHSSSSLTLAPLARFPGTCTTSPSTTTPTQSKVHSIFVCNWVTIYHVIAFAFACCTLPRVAGSPSIDRECDNHHTSICMPLNNLIIRSNCSIHSRLKQLLQCSQLKPTRLSLLHTSIVFWHVDDAQHDPFSQNVIGLVMVGYLTMTKFLFKGHQF